MDEILYYEDLSYIPKVIQIKLISRSHDNLLIDFFSIEKTGNLKFENTTS